jgi:tripeptide aminopeptidase
VRGGTDGSQLSYRGLPCPNLGTGGHGFHGPYEHISVQDMDKVVEILINLVSIE